MSNLPYSISNNNVPKDFDIFDPVFCVAITWQCCLRKPCKWANAYLQYQYVLYILYVYKVFICCTLYTFYYSTKIKVPQYILNCSCNWTVQEFTDIQFNSLRNKWRVCNIHARAAIKLETHYGLKRCLHIGCALNL